MTTGKIIKGIAGFYYVYAEENFSIYECKAKGIFRNKKIKPLVGDDVEIEILDEAEKEGNIVSIFPRKNSLIRPAVANVDQVVVVFAMAEPEPHLNLLDRFLVMMERQHIPAKICFNKCELANKEECSQFQRIYESAGYEVFFMSVKEQIGLETVREMLHGKTTVLAGPSGVGKSSFLNEMIPDAQMETGSVSEKIKRGKHTTRHSEFFFLESETFLLDTPGFSSIYTDEILPEDMELYFPEFDLYRADCRFSGCVHTAGKECGIRNAVEEGKIARSRYENYKLMYQESKDKKRY
ncbi:MAG: ribosome small subunit-dependent GTPase A [Lachnospiraceae bacterium]